MNWVSAHVELMPLSSVGGYSNEPALSIANDTLSEILAWPHPWKFNRNTMFFVPAQNKQDFKFGGAVCFTLSSSGCVGGVGIALKSNNGITTTGFPGTVTVNTLDPHNFNVGDTVYLTGCADSVYNSTESITPTLSQWSGGYVIASVPSSTSFTFAAISGQTMTSGASGVTDFAWIEYATMVNENEDSSPRKVFYLEGGRELEPTSRIAVPEKVMATDNQDGTLTLRFWNVPGAAPWGVTITYQKKPPLLSSLSSTWTPIPDDYAFVYRAVFLAKAFDYIGSGRAAEESQKAQMAIMKALRREDAENDEEFIVPENPLMGWDYGF